MIVLHPTKNQIEIAKNLYSFVELNGSITKGQSNIYGALGEVVVYDFFKGKGFDVSNNSTYDYDLIINNHKVDVKTKRTNVIPKDDYLCSISAFNTRQKCDFYFFLRINENMQDCYLLGYKSKFDFYQEAIFNKKGDKDVNGWDFKDDCFNLAISKLNKFNN